MILVLVVIAIAVVSVVMITGVPGSPNHLGWRLSGVWQNQSDTLQIMIHEQDAHLHGHVVSADIRENDNKIVVGKMVVDRVKLRAAWKWSTGKYIDPYTMEEFEFKIKLRGGNKLKVCYLDDNNLIRKEEWTLISPS